jgi:hypothetical protein
MKRILLIIAGIVGVLALLLTGLFFYTQSHSPLVTVKLEGKTSQVKIEYCQPQKKGREIFGKLVPFGKVWRTGANWATKIELAQDTKIGDKQVKKGTYSLFTIPEKDKWVIILNSVVRQWGHFSYDSTKDVMRTEVPAKTIEKSVEGFTISFVTKENQNLMRLNWDTTEVDVSIE